MKKLLNSPPRMKLADAAKHYWAISAEWENPSVKRTYRTDHALRLLKAISDAYGLPMAIRIPAENLKTEIIAGSSRRNKNHTAKIYKMGAR